MGYGLKVRGFAGQLNKGIRNRGIINDAATGRIDGVAIQWKGREGNWQGGRSVDHFCYVIVLCDDMLCGSSVSDILVEVSSGE